MLMAMRSLDPSSQGDLAVSFLLKCYGLGFRAYVPYFRIIVDDAELDMTPHPGLSSAPCCGPSSLRLFRAFPPNQAGS